MTSSHFSHVTDELLSAYLDNDLSDEDRSLVERAVAAEPAIAWRLETLRQTVQLLRSLPAVALPRSFALAESTTPAGATPVAVHPAPLPQRTPQAGYWETLRASWRTFWQVGSPLLRNAAAVSFALFLLLVAGDLVTPTTPARTTATSATVEQVVAPAAPTVLALAPTATATTAPTVGPTTAAPPSEQRTQANDEIQTMTGPAAVEEAVIASGAPAIQDTQSGPGPENRSPGPESEAVLVPDSPADGSFGGPQVAESMSALLKEPGTAITATGDAAVTTTNESLTSTAPYSATTTMTLTDEADLAVEDGADAAADDATADDGAATEQTEDEGMETAETITGAEQQPAATVAPVLSNPPANPATPSAATLQLLQLVTAAVTLLFLLLWWRSRSRPAKSA
jgi:anti-sigma factor RsiW